MKIAVNEDNTGYAPASERFSAYDADTYCGCPDCHCPVGTGPSKLAAVIDLIEQMVDIEADQRALAELDEQRELELEADFDPIYDPMPGDDP